MADIPVVGQIGARSPLPEPPDPTDALQTSLKNLLGEGGLLGNPLRPVLQQAINLMAGVGDEAEEAYQAALAPLRAAGAVVIPLIQDVYSKLPEDQYLTRWSVVQLVADLQTLDAIGFLERILSTPIPPERSPDPHSLTTVGEEVMIRTTAIEALARLSANGNTQALEAIRQQVRHQNRSVRIAAVTTLVEQGGDSVRQQLADLLPEDERSFVDIRRLAPSEVLQPDPTEHLLHPDIEKQFPDLPALP